MDIETIKRDYPDLVRKIEEKAISKLASKIEKEMAEAKRVWAVLDQSMPGHESLTLKLALDGVTTGPEAAVLILKAYKEANYKTAEEKYDAEEFIHFISLMENRYQTLKIPYYVWVTTFVCLNRKAQLPEWAINYWWVVSRTLADYCDKDKRPTGFNNQELAYEVLGLKQGTGMSNFGFDKDKKQFGIVEEIFHRWQLADFKGIVSIYESIANEKGIDAETVKKLWYGKKNWIESIRNWQDDTDNP